ncbi:hypothetical protein EY643_08505 [Halioglobus maricola]|uniref:Uncharacterized protein n=1 Tax=Halioglobus maricola TaxID=2601894 RepID=A0A5P9NIY1_9GAMM|nr:hypothetical protein [Halioglobus maricola]QFU75692.1 hypothetical protein EY643_08505 [Halioglobus maricola]
MKNSAQRILALMLFVFPLELAFAEEVTREEGLALMDECQRQREENIAPLREQEIENCVDQQGKDRDYCERYNRDFGESRSTATGGMRLGLFWDLPVCEDAFEAERYFKMNPRAKSFTLP